MYSILVNPRLDSVSVLVPSAPTPTVFKVATKFRQRDRFQSKYMTRFVETAAVSALRKKSKDSPLALKR
jgi:hypothetical protein